MLGAGPAVPILGRAIDVFCTSFIFILTFFRTAERR